ncbi:hypothetical protein MLD52_00990 [Puniceicoccaceae bacterium K14]|nr:hypothetical protein [Puniceicoccaceae bacterium K14]
MKNLDTPRDELYIELEQTREIKPLLEARFEGKAYVMAYEAKSDWGGRIFEYFPGHDAEVASHPITVSNVKAMLEFC